MFFFKEEERTINLHPSFFGPNITKYLDDQLLGDVEGTLQGDYFVVCVMQPHEYSDGKIVPGSSFAEFVVHYRAIVWKPFKGEVVCRMRTDQRAQLTNVTGRRASHRSS